MLSKDRARRPDLDEVRKVLAGHATGEHRAEVSPYASTALFVADGPRTTAPSPRRRGRSIGAFVGVALVVAVAVAMLAGRFVLAREEAAPEPVTTTDAPGRHTPG